MYIVCGQGELRLLEVKPDNGRLMTFEDFVNGRHVMAGESFLNG
jgi:methionyl-tRNA formyltransferase